MQIRILTENLASDMVWLAEWGFSAWIEYQGTNVLFDTGYSDVYVRNAAHAGIDLDSVDVIALSHLHRDHTRGLLFHPFEGRKRLILHPRILQAGTESVTVEKTARSAAAREYPLIVDRLEQDFDLEPATGPLEIVPGAFFLGEIPRVTPFEAGCYKDDPMIDDTALAFRTNKGAVVISGCSHAGICNICEHAKSVTGQDLHAVIGGFHLLHAENPPVAETLEYFAREAPAHLMPMHCIDFDIQALMQQRFGLTRPGSGSLIEL